MAYSRKRIATRDVKILIDMNLSPRWAEILAGHGWLTKHWTEIGDPRATDQLVMKWAAENQFVVMTHDLDFGTLLATSQAEGPSVVQLRTGDILSSFVVTSHLPASFSR